MEKKAPNLKELVEEKAPTYIVIFNILEDGKPLSPGSTYSGKYAKKLLEGGSIKKKE